MKVLFAVFFIATLVSKSPAQWSRTNGPEGSVAILTAQVGQTVVLGTRYGEAYYSTNGGQSWNEGVGLPPSFAPDLAVRGTNIYAATERGVFVSTNQGATWTSFGLSGVYLRAIANKNGTLFAIRDVSGGIIQTYRYDDAGQIWTPAGTINGLITAYRLYPKGNMLFAGFSGFFSAQFVHRSADNGQTWTDVSGSLTGAANIFLERNSKLYVGTSNGLFSTTNDGNSWELVGLSGFNVSALTSIGDTLFAGTQGRGIYWSTNNGISWSQRGLRFKSPYHLSVYSGILVACTNYNGVYRSADRGQTWQVSNEGIFGVYTTSFVKSRGGIFAGTAGNIFRSTNSGQSWVNLGDAMPVLDTTEILSGTNIVYDMAVDTVNNIIYAGGLSGLYKSTNDGQTWTGITSPVIGKGRIEAVHVSHTDPGQQVLLAGKGTGVDFAGLFRSTDAGITWKRDSLGTQFRYVYVLDFDQRSDTIFAATGYSSGTSGVYRSTDNGNTWQYSSNGLPGSAVEELLVTPQGVVFAGSEGGVYRSLDRGTTWQFVWNNSDAIRFASDNQGNIYAGSNGGFYPGVYRSTNNGGTWQPFVNGLPANPQVIPGLAFINNDLYAGVDRLGAWVYRFGPTSIRESGQISEYMLEQNYPNPFNPITTIAFTVPVNGSVSLKVYNMLGQEMGTLVNEQKAAGRYTVTLDASGFASGAYIYRLQAGSFVDTRKFSVLK